MGVSNRAGRLPTSMGDVYQGALEGRALHSWSKTAIDRGEATDAGAGIGGSSKASEWSRGGGRNGRTTGGETGTLGSLEAR